MIQEQTVSTLQGHQEVKILARRGHFLQKQNGLHSQVLQSLQILLQLPLHESELGHFLHTWLKPFSMIFNFNENNFRR